MVDGGCLLAGFFNLFFFFFFGFRSEFLVDSGCHLNGQWWLVAVFFSNVEFWGVVGGGGLCTSFFFLAEGQCTS